MLEILSYQAWVQIFGFAVFGLYATASYHKSRLNFFVQESIGAFGMGLQTLLLGSWLGLITNTVHGLMMLAGRFHPDLKIGKKVLIAGMISTILLSALVWETSVMNIVCIVATLLNFLARSFTSDYMLRSFAMMGCGLWILFYCLLGSWAGLLFSALALSGHLKIFMRYVVANQNTILPQN